MRLGICIYDIAHASLAQKAGFDYFEYPFSKLVSMTDIAFDAFCEEVNRLGFFPEVMVKMLDSAQHLTGDNVDTQALHDYCEKGFARCARLGVKGFVFGSDGARNLPEGFTDRMKGYDQLEAFLLMVSELAEPYGYEFYIEPLTMGHGKGANIISFIGEGAYLALRVNRPNVALMVDWYHSTNNRDSMRMIPYVGELLRHFHLSTLDRKYPSANDQQDYSEFFDALKAIGYNGRVTIEAKTPAAFEEAAQEAVKRIKPLM